jgi:spore germination protein GerM
MTITEGGNLISVFHDGTSYLDAEVDQLRLTKKGNEQIITKKSIKKQGVSSAVAKLRLTLLADDKNHNIIRQVVVEVNKGLRSAFLWKNLGTCEVIN